VRSLTHSSHTLYESIPYLMPRHFIPCFTAPTSRHHQMTLGKFMMSDHKLKSIWSSVLLTNGLALPMLLLLASSRGEFDDFFEVSRESIIQSFS
jgi:hypothetical protein